MTRVALASLAAATPMGQQEYERQLLAHLPAAGVDVSSIVVRSMRSTLPGNARLPLNALSRAPRTVQYAAARLAYRTSGLVHRADLRLPAARNEVVTVHDLAPLRFGDEGAISDAALTTLRRARRVVCPSQFSADEVRAFTDLEAVVVHNGLDPEVWAQPEAGRLKDLALADVFVLHSGGATERKNLAGLAGAWRSLAGQYPSVDLVLCGPPDARRDSLFAELPRVRQLGRVDRRTHLALMSAAAVVVVPSTYEGFGFPALEAMALRTPVVAANRGSLPEVCGSGAVLAEPDGDSLATAIGGLLADPSAAATMVDTAQDHARQFTWEAAAARYAAVYAGVST